MINNVFFRAALTFLTHQKVSYSRLSRMSLEVFRRNISARQFGGCFRTVKAMHYPPSSDIRLRLGQNQTNLPFLPQNQSHGKNSHQKPESEATPLLFSAIVVSFGVHKEEEKEEETPQLWNIFWSVGDFDVETDLNVLDGSGWTKLGWSVYADDVETVKTLIKNGADWRLTFREGKNLWHYVQSERMAILLAWVDKYSEMINKPDNHDLPPLVMAIDAGDLKRVRILLNHGADPTMKFRCWWIDLEMTPLEYAEREKEHWERFESPNYVKEYQKIINWLSFFSKFS